MKEYILKIIIIIAYLLMAVSSVFSQASNDNCEGATKCYLSGIQTSCYFQGTTVGATPSKLLTWECCDTATNDVWYQVLNCPFRYMLISAERDSEQYPEIAVFVMSPADTINPDSDDGKMCDDIDCSDFNSATTKGLGYQRGNTSYPQHGIIINNYKGPLGFDMMIVIKEATSNVSGSFKLYVLEIKPPSVNAGNPVQYHCLNNDTTFQMRGSVYLPNGLEMDEMQWSLLNVYNGMVDTIIGESTKNPQVKFSGYPPYKADFQLISYRIIQLKEQDHFDSIPGYDTTTLIVQYPTLLYPDTIYVQRNKPIKLTDNMLTTGCLDVEEAFTWEPTLGLDNAYTRNPKVTLNKDRTYYVRMNCSGCVDTEKVVVIVGDPPIGINDEPELQLYFSQSRLIINGAKQPSNIQLFDVQGRLMLELTESDFQASDGVTYADISNNQLQKGIYFAVVKAGEKEARMKVLRW